MVHYMSQPGTSQSSSLKCFLMRLLQDPLQGAEFRHDPGAVLQRSDLSPAERNLLLNGNERHLRDQLGDFLPVPIIIFGVQQGPARPAVSATT